MGYELSNFKWGDPQMGSKSGAVTVAANLSNLTYDKSKYDEDDFTGALNKALNTWEKVAHVNFVENGSGSADIDFDAAKLDGSTIGLASIGYSYRDGVNRINAADVTFDTEENWSPNGEGGGQNFFAVALHEIGHAFGLGHFSNRGEIMNPVISASKLGAGDIEGAQALYGKDGRDQDTHPDWDKVSGMAPLPGVEEETIPDTPENDPPQDDDEDGGLIDLLFGGLIGMLKSLMGNGGGPAGGGLRSLIAGKDEPIEIPKYEGSGITLDDVVPTYEYVDHGHGCTCGCQPEISENDDGSFEIVHQLFG